MSEFSGSVFFVSKAFFNYIFDHGLKILVDPLDEKKPWINSQQSEFWFAHTLIMFCSHFSVRLVWKGGLLSCWCD